MTSRRAIPCKPRQLAGEYWHAPFPFWRLKSRYLPNLSYLEIGGTDAGLHALSVSAVVRDMLVEWIWPMAAVALPGPPAVRSLVCTSVLYPMRVPTKRSKPHPALEKGVGSNI